MDNEIGTNILKRHNDDNFIQDYISLTPCGGVKKKTIVKGHGIRPPSGHEVHIHYIGKFQDGSVFDSSYDRNRPFSFQLGNKEVISGLEIAISQMYLGERALLTISPQFAYGDSGSLTTIPPNSTLIFEVELISCNPKKDGIWSLNLEEKLQAANDLKEKGNYYLTNIKDINGAIKLYTDALQYFDDKTDEFNTEERAATNSVKLGIHLNLSLCYLKTELFSMCIAEATKAIAIKKDSSKAYYRRGLAKMYYGLLDDAKSDLMYASTLEGHKNIEILKKLKSCDEKQSASKKKESARYKNVLRKLNIHESLTTPLFHGIESLPRVFLLIQKGMDLARRLEIVLFSDTFPKIAENFRRSCTGSWKSDDESPVFEYKNSLFHKIVPGLSMQGGDFSNSNKAEGISHNHGIFDGQVLSDPHNSMGLLSMPNSAENFHGSQFSITFAPAPHLDRDHVIFGKIINGAEFLKEFEKVKTDNNGKPLVPVKIVDCGEIIQ